MALPFACLHKINSKHALNCLVHLHIQKFHTLLYLQKFHTLLLTPAASTSGCAIKYILGQQSPAPPLSVYLDRYWHIQGDKNGRLYLWDIRKVNNSTPLSPSGPHSQISANPESSACITDSWEHPAMPCGLTDRLVCTCVCIKCNLILVEL